MSAIKVKSEAIIFHREMILSILKKEKDIFNKYQIKTLALFGSTARNKATENSDLDFLVEFQTTPTFDNYMNLKFYLEELFNKPIDLVIKQDLKPIIREKVIEEAINI